MYYDEISKEFVLYNNRKQEFGRGANMATLFQFKSSHSIITESEIFMLRINCNHNKLQSVALDIKQATDYRWSKPQLNQLINAKQKKIKSNDQQAILDEIKTNDTNQQFNNINNKISINNNNNNNTIITNSNNKNIINFNFTPHPQQQQQLLQMQLLYQQQQLQMQTQMQIQMQMQMQKQMSIQTAQSLFTTTQKDIYV